MPTWKEEATSIGHEPRDPPLSTLGHAQARETAAEYFAKLPEDTKPTAVLCSPFLRVIQTCAPTADALNLKIQIELGLAETHYIPGRLPDAAARFQYFPQVDYTYTPLMSPAPTPGAIDETTSLPVETWPEGYLERMKAFAPVLGAAAKGKRMVCFSHAASSAIVAALTGQSLADVGKFAPCGVFHLKKAAEEGAPWVIERHGGSNAPYVSSNHESTYPWGYPEDFHKLW